MLAPGRGDLVGAVVTSSWQRGAGWLEEGGEHGTSPMRITSLPRGRCPVPDGDIIELDAPRARQQPEWELAVFDAQNGRVRAK